MLSSQILNRHNHKHHGHSSQHQAQRQEDTRVAAIGNAGHNELRETVSHGIHRKHDTQLSLFKAKWFEHGNGHGEILTNNIETGITDERSKKYLPA